jgi:hypothetical protein
MQTTSSFQRAIETIEALPIDEQITLIDLMQNRLKHQRRQNLLQQVAEAQQDYATGNVKKGTVADFMAELDD